MKKTFYSVIIVAALLVVMGEKAPEASWGYFLGAKVVAFAAMYLAGKPLTKILEAEDEAERLEREKRKAETAASETLNK